MNKNKHTYLTGKVQQLLVVLCFVILQMSLLGQATADVEFTAYDYIPLTGNVSLNDNLPQGTRSHQFLNEPFHGEIEWNNSSEGSFTYLVNPMNVQIYAGGGIWSYPAPFTIRLDSIFYEVCTGNFCDTSLIEIFIAFHPDSPVALNDTFYVETGSLRQFDVSLNDYDPDSLSDPNRYPNRFFQRSLPSNAHNSVTAVQPYLEEDGTFEYQSAAEFTGTDSFTYIMFDPLGCVDSSLLATVTIQVLTNDDSPFASTVNLGDINEESTRNQNLTFYTFDPEGETMTYRIIEQGTGGVATVSTLGAFTYTANLNFIGQDTLYYEVMDLVGQTDTALIVLNVVNANNDAPVAPPRSFSILEDTPLNASVAFEDLIDGDILSYSIENQPTQGTASISASGTLIYTPIANYVGPDVFTYRSCDAGNLCSSASITILVDPVNDLPVALNDSNELPINGTLTGTLQANVTDIDSPLNAMFYSISLATANGSIELASNGTYTYTPNEFFYGDDTFMYSVCDNTGGCTIASVDITVTLINLPPEAENASVTLNEDIETIIGLDAFTFDFGSSDLVYAILDSPIIGLFTNITNQGILFQPEPNVYGTYLISYRVCDTGNLCDTAQIEVNILPVNDAPTAFNSSYVVLEDAVLNWEAQYSDIDGDLLAFTILAPPTYGILQDNSYIPAANYTGADSFFYQVCDEFGACSVGSIEITITPVNDYPTASNDSIAGVEDTWISGNVSSNDIDIDSSELTYFSLVENNPYSISLENDGAFSWLPPSNFSGIITFEYSCCDNEGFCDTATVTLSIEEVNDIPLVSFPPVLLPEDGQVEYTAIYYAFDTEGQNIQQSIVTANGVEVNLNPTTGFLQLAATSNYFGTAWVVLNTCDYLGGCSIDTIFIEIEPVNDAPFGFDGTYTTFQNTSLYGSWYNHVFDIDDDTHSFNAQAIIGEVINSTNGQFEFTPLENFVGLDTIWLTACDSSNACISLQFIIEILPPNQAPIVTDAQRSICQGSYSEIALSELALDEVDAAEQLQYTFYSTVSSTFIIDEQSQSLIITPTSFFSGEMTIEFEVCDNDSPALCSLGNITLNISPTIIPEITAVEVNAISCFGMNDGSIIIQDVSDNAGVSYLWEDASSDSAINNLSAGTYSVQITGLSDCSVSTIAQFTISEPQELTVVLSAQSISSPSNGLIESTVSGGTPPYNYQWEGPNDYTANTSSISNLNSAGPYNLVVTDANGCNIESVEFISGTNSFSFETLSVYPNPSQGQAIRIKLPTDVHTGSSLRLVDATGRPVFESLTDDKSLILPKGTLSSGIYYVIVSGTLRDYRAPVVIEH